MDTNYIGISDNQFHQWAIINSTNYTNGHGL